MDKEIRKVIADSALGVEACFFKGLLQPFPNHFHDYYVIGSVIEGARRMTCNNREYRLGAGDLVLLAPGDAHGCDAIDGRPLCYRSFHVSAALIDRAAVCVSADGSRPVFRLAAAHDPKLALAHEQAFLEFAAGERDARREAMLLAFLTRLLKRYGRAGNQKNAMRMNGTIGRLCAWIQHNHAAPISLDDMSSVSGLNKYTLLRTFARSLGITPHKYLETIRLSKAGTLLQSGMEPAEAAAMAGFADQSHLGRLFKRYIGLTPKRYQQAFRPNEPGPPAMTGLQRPG